MDDSGLRDEYNIIVRVINAKPVGEELLKSIVTFESYRDMTSEQRKEIQKKAHVLVIRMAWDHCKKEHDDAKKRHTEQVESFWKDTLGVGECAHEHKPDDMGVIKCDAFKITKTNDHDIPVGTMCNVLAKIGRTDYYWTDGDGKRHHKWVGWHLNDGPSVGYIE